MCYRIGCRMSTPDVVFPNICPATIMPIATALKLQQVAIGQAFRARVTLASIFILSIFDEIDRLWYALRKDKHILKSLPIGLVASASTAWWLQVDHRIKEAKARAFELQGVAK